MKFPIRNKIALPKQVPEEPKKKLTGMGDIVEKVAGPIKNILMKVPNETFQRYLSNCKCKERKEWLNKHIPFRKK